MNKIKLLTVTLLFVLFSYTQVLAQETITLGSGEWSPYFSEKLMYYGVTSRVVSEAFASEGFDVKYAFRPWKRSMEEAKKGKWVGTPGWSKNDERQKDFYYSEPIAQEENVFFYVKGTGFKWDNIGDLAKYKIGAIKGYSYGEEIDSADKNGSIKVQRIGEELANFKKLLAGRVDVVLNNLDTGYNTILKNLSPEEAARITHHTKTVNSRPLYLLISKKADNSEALRDSFNKGLAKLKEGGQYEQYHEESRQGEYKEK